MCRLMRNQVVQADDVGRTSTDGDSFRVRQQVVVGPDRLQVTEEIKGILAVDLERVVLTERQRLRIEPELQLRGRAAQRQVQGPQCRRQPLQVGGRTPVAEVDIMRASACPPTTMNSTPCSARTAQNRSSWLCSRRSSNGLNPQRVAPCPVSPARPLRRRDAQVGANQREIHTVLIVLPRRPERLGRGRNAGRGIAAGVSHRRYSTGVSRPRLRRLLRVQA